MSGVSLPCLNHAYISPCRRLVAANEPDARLSTFAFADLLGARSLINAAAVNVIHGVEQVGPFTFGDIECSASGEQHLVRFKAPLEAPIIPDRFFRCRKPFV